MTNENDEIRVEKTKEIKCPECGCEVIDVGGGCYFCEICGKKF